MHLCTARLSLSQNIHRQMQVIEPQKQPYTAAIKQLLAMKNTIADHYILQILLKK